MSVGRTAYREILHRLASVNEVGTPYFLFLFLNVISFRTRALSTFTRVLLTCPRPRVGYLGVSLPGGSETDPVGGPLSDSLSGGVTRGETHITRGDSLGPLKVSTKGHGEALVV